MSREKGGKFRFFGGAVIGEVVDIVSQLLLMILANQLNRKCLIRLYKSGDSRAGLRTTTVWLRLRYRRSRKGRRTLSWCKLGYRRRIGSALRRVGMILSLGALREFSVTAKFNKEIFKGSVKRVFIDGERGGANVFRPN
jgi:hypothetical protein